MKRIAILAAFVLVSCRSMSHQTGFLDRTVTIGTTPYSYVVYVPRNWDPSRQWPVILFLHGAGERGTDGIKPTAIALGHAIRMNSARVPAIVVFPQVPPEERWIGEPADAAMRALDLTMREFSGDPRRVYLSGYSMGGYGTWHLALAHPHRFAALAIVCGGIVPAGSATSVRQSPLTAAASDPYAFTANALKDIPIWIFHGADDTVVLPSESRRMNDALRAAGGNVRYTEYPGTNHNSWDKAYGEEALWTWMFSQTLK